ncbi:sigma-70 family RNA polymerase sigma factor [Streptomyces sp. NPDC102441]|uniref:sigma-70 family RNA polymerase sigma factor n=1 Tax=Streptomyces sp. NPDC102441 TaxID=3366176 RepID=UPI00381177BE
MRSKDIHDRPDISVVLSAREGDPQGLEELVEGYLPLVYNVVGRAMDGHPDVDDVVQETVLRVVDKLSSLREPERFRSWLIAIAVRQVRDWRHRNQAGPQLGLYEDAVHRADPLADFTDVTVLRLELAGQRLEAAEATRWLEDEDREILSLWWLEAAGQLTRAELAAASELPPRHATVRVQRVKERLEAARSILRALAASPRCSDLAALLPPWDGSPNALWRKRLHRHVRDCPRCSLASSALMPVEGLLGGLALVPLPVGLTAAVLHTALSAPSKATATSAQAGTRGPVTGGTARAPRTLARLVAGPAGAATAGGVLLVGLAAWYVTAQSHGPDASAPATPTTSVTANPATSPAPTPTRTPTSTPTLTPTSPSPVISTAASTLLGSHTLRSISHPDRYVARSNGVALVARVGAESPASARTDATFTVTPGLADRHCFSFKDTNGEYLRHFNFRIRRDANDGSPLFQADATFCVRSGSVEGSVSLESHNYPGRYLRCRDNLELWLDPSEETGRYRSSTSFEIAAPWAVPDSEPRN